MRILVIGSGFIGLTMIRRLQDDGHEVLSFSRQVNVDITCEQIIGDFFNLDDLRNLLACKPEIVILTAWITTHKVYQEDPLNSDYARFAIKLGSVLLESRVRHFIVLGSCAEYGEQVGPITAGITELRPSTFYAKQKVFAFYSLRDLLNDSSIRFTWARIFQPYGQRQDHNRLIPYLIRCLKKDEKISLVDCNSVLDWVTTRDIASAISWIISNQTPIEIDIGTTIGTTNLELLQHLESLLEVPLSMRQSKEFLPSAGKMVLVSKDSPLIISGWQPLDSLNNGLRWVLNS